MQDVAIIGAGELGGAIAHALARSNLVRSITLIDETRRVAAGKALDIAQAAPIEGFATQVSGATDVSMAAGASIVILADRVTGGEWQGEDGLVLLKRLSQTASRRRHSLRRPVAARARRPRRPRAQDCAHAAVRVGARVAGRRGPRAGGAGGQRIAARHLAVGARRAARAHGDPVGRRHGRRVRAHAPRRRAVAPASRRARRARCGRRAPMRSPRPRPPWSTRWRGVHAACASCFVAPDCLRGHAHAHRRNAGQARACGDRGGRVAVAECGRAGRARQCADALNWIIG